MRSSSTLIQISSKNVVTRCAIRHSVSLSITTRETANRSRTPSNNSLLLRSNGSSTMSREESLSGKSTTIYHHQRSSGERIPSSMDSMTNSAKNSTTPRYSLRSASWQRETSAANTRSISMRTACATKNKKPFPDSPPSGISRLLENSWAWLA